MDTREPTREREYERAALAWMRAQAKVLVPSLEDDTGPLTCAEVIAAALAARPKPPVGGMIVWAALDVQQRHAEPLYFWTEDEVEDGLEHLKSDPSMTRCLLVPLTPTPDNGEQHPPE